MPMIRCVSKLLRATLLFLTILWVSHHSVECHHQGVAGAVVTLSATKAFHKYGDLFDDSTTMRLHFELPF